jgi:hypothetical protein
MSCATLAAMLERNVLSAFGADPFGPCRNTTRQEHMPRSNQARAGAAVLVALTVALAACSDLVNPNGRAANTPRLNLIQADTSKPVSISQVILSSKTLTIGGDDLTYTTTIVSNQGGFSGYSLRGSIVQHQLVYPGVAQGISCDKSACTFARQFFAPPGVTSGPALFELELVDFTGKIVQAVNVGLTLVSSQSIASLTLPGDTILIEGSSIPYTATLQNTGPSVSGLSLQGRVVQGAAQRFAGGVTFTCGGASGVLPNGSCTVVGQLSATNNTAGAGTLVSGAAAFEVQLVDSAGHIFATGSVPLTLIEGPLTSPPPGPDSNNDRFSNAGRARLGRP